MFEPSPSPISIHHSGSQFRILSLPLNLTKKICEKKCLDTFGLDKHLLLNEWNSMCSSLAAAGASTHHGILSAHAWVVTIRLSYYRSDNNQKIWKALVNLCKCCSKWIHTCISQQKVHQNLSSEKRATFSFDQPKHLAEFCPSKKF